MKDFLQQLETKNQILSLAKNQFNKDTLNNFEYFLITSKIDISLDCNKQDILSYFYEEFAEKNEAIKVGLELEKAIQSDIISKVNSLLNN